MKLNPISPYDNRVIEWLSAIQPDLWNHLALVPTLPEETAFQILRYFVKLACEPTNIRPITIGREAVLELPRIWVLKNIERIALENLDLEDDWEFRRLAELYSMLNKELVQKHVLSGLKSSNPEIREAAKDF